MSASSGGKRIAVLVEADRGRDVDRRLAHAASDVCGTASESDLVGKNRVIACRHSVLADARAKGEQLARQGNPIAVASR